MKKKNKMLKYFEIPFTVYKGIVVKIYRPNDLTKEINSYADKNNLEIVSISVYENKGIYVAFKQRSIN